MSLEPAERPATRTRVSRRVPIIAGVVSLVLAVLLGMLVTAGGGENRFAVDEAWAELMVSLRTPFASGSPTP